MNLSGIVAQTRLLSPPKAKPVSEQEVHKNTEQTLNQVNKEAKDKASPIPLINDPLKSHTTAIAMGDLIKTLVHNFADSKNQEEQKFDENIEQKEEIPEKKDENTETNSGFDVITNWTKYENMMKFISAFNNEISWFSVKSGYCKEHVNTTVLAVVDLMKIERNARNGHSFMYAIEHFDEIKNKVQQIFDDRKIVKDCFNEDHKV